MPEWGSSGSCGSTSNGVPYRDRSLRAYPGASDLHGGWRDHAGAHVIINREIRFARLLRRGERRRGGQAPPRCAARVKAIACRHRPRR